MRFKWSKYIMQCTPKMTERWTNTWQTCVPYLAWMFWGWCSTRDHHRCRNARVVKEIRSRWEHAAGDHWHTLQDKERSLQRYIIEIMYYALYRSNVWGRLDFKRSLFCSPRLQLCDQKYSKNYIFEI